jgi:hypothetical protein
MTSFSVQTVDFEFKPANQMPPHCYHTVAPVVGGSAWGSSNADAIARHHRAKIVVPSLSSTSTRAGGSARDAGTSAPGVGATAARWNQPKGHLNQFS